MKAPTTKQFALGFAALLAVGCTEILPSQSSSQTPSVISPQTAKTPTVLKSGKFVKAEHPTQGMARIVSENGAQFLEFDPAFKTDNGPDLYVILSRDKQPPIAGIKEQSYRSLGRLQQISGTQRYAIPPDVNLSEFPSVAIWCRQFNATFGYAQFKS